MGGVGRLLYMGCLVLSIDCLSPLIRALCEAQLLSQGVPRCCGSKDIEIDYSSASDHREDTDDITIRTSPRLQLTSSSSPHSIEDQITNHFTFRQLWSEAKLFVCMSYPISNMHDLGWGKFSWAYTMSSMKPGPRKCLQMPTTFASCIDHHRNQAD